MKALSETDRQLFTVASKQATQPSMAAVATSPSLAGAEKKHWWLRLRLTNKKMMERYVREAKMLIATREETEITAALGLLEAALAVAPRAEAALEMKARCLLYLRRYKEVADMLQDYIPSLKTMLLISDDDDTSCGSSSCSDNSSTQLTLLSSRLSGDDDPAAAFKCFSSVSSGLKKKLMAPAAGFFGINVEEENNQGQWRYSVLGEACCHLGLMEDAMALLQTGKRLATAAFRRESISLSEDIFSFKRSFPLSLNNQPETPPSDNTASHHLLVCHLKLLIRRKAAAVAALDAGLHSESIRHFSKILDGRRAAPQGFLSECYVRRASAYRSAGRIAEAIADCNRALALDTSCIEALAIRAALFETIRCLPDSLHDLEHLKLLYNSILRDRKLPGPVWKQQKNVEYREISGRLCSLASKMQQLKQRVAAGETGNVDYYALIGLRRGCSRSELERAHLLLTLKHKPDKSSMFIDKCEFADDKDMDSVRDRAKLSALMLYRLIQKGYTSVMATILDEEAVEKQRNKAAAALMMQAAIQAHKQAPVVRVESVAVSEGIVGGGGNRIENIPPAITPQGSAIFQGVFCRDLATVGNLLSQGGFNHTIPLNYEALSC